MKYYQGQIVMVREHTLPHQEVKPHPFLIISCLAANQQEKEAWYTGVMLTHMEGTDHFTFEIKPDMVDGYLDKEFQQIRLYIITGFPESQITKLMGTMKPHALKKVLKDIKNFFLI